MGAKQLGFMDYELTTAKKRNKREKFLAEMDAVVPCQALLDLIDPNYPSTSKKVARPPSELSLQQVLGHTTCSVAWVPARPEPPSGPVWSWP